jgi:hypothetical protein
MSVCRRYPCSHVALTESGRRPRQQTGRSARGGIAVRMSWRHRKPPIQRISITPRNSAEEIQMLSTLVRNLNEVVQSLWDTVHDLRLELGTIRPEALIADHAEPRPPTWRMPPASADLDEQVDTLRRQVDELNGDAEYLWFGAQWLRAQLAVARGDASPPGESP